MKVYEEVLADIPRSYWYHNSCKKWFLAPWYSVLSIQLKLQPATTPTQPHRISNTHRTKNITTNVVIQQNSRKLLMMDILMSETCWAHKKWNKIASDIKLVFYSSTITMMHGPINHKIGSINLYCAPDVTRVIKSRRVDSAWYSCIMRMGEIRCVWTVREETTCSPWYRW